MLIYMIENVQYMSLDDVTVLKSKIVFHNSIVFQ